MPLEAFAKATTDIGGIQINDQTLTEDEQKLDTDAKIYNYVDKSTDRNAAMTEVIKSLASKSADAGVIGLKNTVDTVSDALTASVERDDFGELIKLLVDMFKNEPTVCQIGYDTATIVVKNQYETWAENYLGFGTMNYDYEVAKLVSAIYPSAK